MKKIFLILLQTCLLMFTALDAGKDSRRPSDTGKAKEGRNFMRLPSKRPSDSGVDHDDTQAQQASYDELASRIADVEKNIKSLTPAEKAATCFVHEVWGKQYVKIAVLLFIFMESKVILANGQSLFSTVMSNMRRDGYIAQTFLDYMGIFNVAKDDPIGALGLFKDWMLDNKVLTIGCSWLVITVLRLIYLSSKDKDNGIYEASGLSDFKRPFNKIFNKINGSRA